MKVKLLLLLALISSCVRADDDFSSDDYLSKSAQSKLDKLWDKITEDKKPLSYYSTFEILQIFFEDLWLTFNEEGDVLPEGRQKLIHTVGNVAKATFVASYDTPYTGVFKGADKLLIRFSVGKEQDPSLNTAEGALGNFTPGIAIKFLRDGAPSGNLVAMFSTAGQASWNPFKNDFTTNFNMPLEPTTTDKALAAKFSSVTANISSVGLKDLAAYNQKGEREYYPRFPFKIIFRPTSAVKTLFPDNFSKSYLSQLMDIPSGTTIYDVIAIDQAGCNEYKMGEIKLATQFTTSRFADEKLFFRHGLVDKDDEGTKMAQYRDSYSIWTGTNLAPTPSKRTGCPFSRFFH